MDDQLLSGGPIDYGHPLLNEYRRLVTECICKYKFFSMKSSMKDFYEDMLESISVSIVMSEGIGSWVPCLDPHIKKLHRPLARAIERLYHDKVRSKRR